MLKRIFGRKVTPQSIDVRFIASGSFVCAMCTGSCRDCR